MANEYKLSYNAQEIDERLGKIATPDWEQSHPEEPGYINNRPFGSNAYSSKEMANSIITNFTWDDLGTCIYGTSLVDYKNLIFSIGAKYTITINDKVYENVQFKNFNSLYHWEAVGFGNPTLYEFVGCDMDSTHVSSPSEDAEEDWCLFFYNGDGYYGDITPNMLIFATYDSNLKQAEIKIEVEVEKNFEIPAIWSSGYYESYLGFEEDKVIYLPENLQVKITIDDKELIGKCHSILNYDDIGNYIGNIDLIQPGLSDTIGVRPSNENFVLGLSGHAQGLLYIDLDESIFPEGIEIIPNQTKLTLTLLEFEEDIVIDPKYLDLSNKVTSGTSIMGGLAVGPYSCALNDGDGGYGVAVGPGALGLGGTAIGLSAQATESAVAIGDQASADDYAIAIVSENEIKYGSYEIVGNYMVLELDDLDSYYDTLFKSFTELDSDSYVGLIIPHESFNPAILDEIMRQESYIALFKDLPYFPIQIPIRNISYTGGKQYTIDLDDYSLESLGGALLPQGEVGLQPICAQDHSVVLGSGYADGNGFSVNGIATGGNSVSLQGRAIGSNTIGILGEAIYTSEDGYSSNSQGTLGILGQAEGEGTIGIGGSVEGKGNISIGGNLTNGNYCKIFTSREKKQSQSAYGKFTNVDFVETKTYRLRLDENYTDSEVKPGIYYYYRSYGPIHLYSPYDLSQSVELYEFETDGDDFVISYGRGFIYLLCEEEQWKCYKLSAGDEFTFMPDYGTFPNFEFGKIYGINGISKSNQFIVSDIETGQIKGRFKGINPTWYEYCISNTGNVSTNFYEISNQGDYTTNFGTNTSTDCNYQTTLGKYNELDSSALLVIGNGTMDNRSNALTINENGNSKFTGIVEAKEIKSNQIGQNFLTLIDIETNKPYALQIKNGEIIHTALPQSVRLLTPPNKIEYYEGEYFDPTGMTFEATYEDGSVKVLSDFEVILPTKSFVYYKDNKVKIKVYTPAPYEIEIEVIVNKFDSEIILQDFNFTRDCYGNYILTSWKETLNGNPSTEMIVPNNSWIVI